jgi:hypothetical protein
MRHLGCLNLEATMKYITVSNRVNKIATVHLATCSFIGRKPDAQSVSAERRRFDDGFEALAFAQTERPDNFGFCGHCLKGLPYRLVPR